MIYQVLVETDLSSWTIHSTWDNEEDARDQADYVGGRIRTKPIPFDYSREN